MIQEEVERRVREALRTELPAAIHEMTGKIFEDLRRDSITEGIDQLDQRRSSMPSGGQEGPIRVRCGTQTDSPQRVRSNSKRSSSAFRTAPQPHSIRSTFSRFQHPLLLVAQPRGA